MFDYDHVLFWSWQTPDHVSSVETLLYVKVRTWFVKHVNICILNACDCNHIALHFSTRELPDLTLQNARKLKPFNDISCYVFLVKFMKQLTNNLLANFSIFR